MFVGLRRCAPQPNLPAQAAFALPGAAHAQLTFLRAVKAVIRLPAKGVRAVQLGFQMHHRAGPVQALEQRLELLDPQAPLILHRAVAGAEVDHLRLVQTVSRLLATGKHLPTEKAPGIARRQLIEHLPIDFTTQTAFWRTVRRPVTDATINDGFGLHAGTPANQGCLLSQPSGPRKELQPNKRQLCARFGPRRIIQASSVINTASPVSTIKGNW